MATPSQWAMQQRWHDEGGDSAASCIIELRDRLAALEAQQQPASPEPTQRTEPEVQGWRVPLWERMHWVGNNNDCDGYAAEIDVVAEWLEERDHHAAADAIRHEARRARGT